MLWYSFLEDTLQESLMVILQPSVLWTNQGILVHFGIFILLISLQQVILKLVLNCSRVFSELCYIARNSCISVASDVTTTTYKDFILVFPLLQSEFNA